MTSYPASAPLPLGSGAESSRETDQGGICVSAPDAHFPMCSWDTRTARLRQSPRRPSEMGDRNRTADDQRHGEDLVKLRIGDPEFGALENVVDDEVVTAQPQRRRQAEHFLDLGGQRAIKVDAVVDVEESLDVLVL